jgi:hypothetical protein
MKKADPQIVDWWQTIQSKIKILRLAPGDWIEDRIEDGSWIFVEEGFLLVMGIKKENWHCCNFLWEGRSTIAHKVCGPIGFEKYSIGFQAVEQSITYYISFEDVKFLSDVCAGFSFAKDTLNSRSWKLQGNVSSILFVSPSRRIQSLRRFYTILLRAPESDLADFLELKSKKQRMILSEIRRKK